jgi:1-deoxyxylulose-5-phosphate synthase
MHPLCADQGVGVLPWSPLARGRLARDWDSTSARTESDEFGKTLYVTSNTADADRAVSERVAQIAKARGVSRAQVALAWVAQRPVVTAPIVGATKPNHLDDAVAALTLDLTVEETTALEEPYVPHPVAGFS